METSYQMERMNDREFYESEKKQLAEDLSKIIANVFFDYLIKFDPKSLETHTTGVFSGITYTASNSYFQEKKIRYKEIGAGLYFDFQVAAFKPSYQESVTGSDVAFFFEVLDSKGHPFVSKTLLIQAKSGTIDGNEVHVSNKDLKEQLKNLIAISPSNSYLLVYTSSGAYFTDAQSALEDMKAVTLTTNKMKDIRFLIEPFLNCTSGDTGLISIKNMRIERDKKGFAKINNAVETIYKIANLNISEAVILSLQTKVNK